MTIKRKYCDIVKNDLEYLKLQIEFHIKANCNEKVHDFTIIDRKVMKILLTRKFTMNV